MEHSLFNHFSWGEVVATATFLIVFFGFAYKSSKDREEDAERLKKELLEALEKHTTADTDMHKTIWARLDSIKVCTQQNYVSKELCNIMHEATAKTVGKIEAKLEMLGARVDEKVDELKQMVAENREMFLKAWKNNGH